MTTDLAFAFDCTGSMYACLGQVRREVDALTKRMFDTIPDLRVGLIAFSDYCDAKTKYVTKILDFTSNREQVSYFIRNVPPGDGGDAPECYELVMHQAQVMTWRKGDRALVIIGDDVPHAEYEAQNYLHLNWRKELDALLTAGIKTYAVQCLNRSHATPFYREIAHKTGGFHLTLDQFRDISSILLAIGYKQSNPSYLGEFERELDKLGRLNRDVERSFSTLMGRSAPSRYSPVDGLTLVEPGRFQMMHVDYKIPISDFVRDHGVLFRPGNGYYELMKPEDVQDHKGVILRDRRTGDLWTGPEARRKLGLPEYGTVRIRPTAVPYGYVAFIQSTSNNRNLMPDTDFYYEVDRSR